VAIAKCRTFSTRNRITAAGRTCSPKANSSSGSPMLPAFLNIIGGSRVLGA